MPWPTNTQPRPETAGVFFCSQTRGRRLLRLTDLRTAEVLQELIKLAQDIRAARNRGEEQGLSDEEIAFYDALAENESALQVMGDAAVQTVLQQAEVLSASWQPVHSRA